MNIELFLGVLFCKLQVWRCFIYKGDSAEFFFFYRIFRYHNYYRFNFTSLDRLALGVRGGSFQTFCPQFHHSLLQQQLNLIDQTIQSRYRIPSLLCSSK